MKTYIPILIILWEVVLLEICNCNSLKLKYYKSHCNFDETNSCYVNLREDLKTKYDTLYAFPTFIPLTGVRNILGRDNYGTYHDVKYNILGFDSDVYRIILVKNRKIIAHWNMDFWESGCENCTVVTGHGIFDRESVEVEGYMCTNHVFKIRTKNK